MTQNDADVKQNRQDTSTLQLRGDLGGTTGSAKVNDIQNIPVLSGTPNEGQYLTYLSGSWSAQNQLQSVPLVFTGNYFYNTNAGAKPFFTVPGDAILIYFSGTHGSPLSDGGGVGFPNNVTIGRVVFIVNDCASGIVSCQFGYYNGTSYSPTPLVINLFYHGTGGTTVAAFVATQAVGQPAGTIDWKGFMGNG